MKPARTIIRAESHHGVDAHGAPGGDVARGDGDEQTGARHAGEGERVMRADAEELVGHQARQSEGGAEANGDADQRHARAVSEHQAHDVAALRAQGHAHADFVSALATR